MADVVAAGNIHQRFTGIVAGTGFAALMRRQLARAAEQHTAGLARLRAGARIAAARKNPRRPTVF